MRAVSLSVGEAPMKPDDEVSAAIISAAGLEEEGCHEPVSSWSSVTVLLMLVRGVLWSCMFGLKPV